MLNETSKVERCLNFLFTSFIFFIYAFRLNFPTEPYYDEVYYVNLVREIIAHQHYSTALTIHPPLAHVIDTLNVLFWGDSSVIWRFSSLCSGLFILYLIFQICLSLTQDRLAAKLAVLFYALDCISLTQARIEMPNNIMQVCILSSLLLFLRFMSERKIPRQRAFLGAGLCLGLALSTKLTSFGLLLLYIILLLLYFLQNPGERKGLLKETGLFFILLPLAVFVAMHLFIPFLKQHTWADLWNIQVTQFNYHTKIAPTQTHGYSSQWWGWPLMIRPIWYYFDQTNGIVHGILCIGNPAIFWIIPLIAGYLIWDATFKHSRISIFLLTAFLSQWLIFSPGVNQHVIMYQLSA